MKTLGFCHLRAVLRPKIKENLRFFQCFWSPEPLGQDPRARMPLEPLGQDPRARMPQLRAHGKYPIARSQARIKNPILPSPSYATMQLNKHCLGSRAGVIYKYNETILVEQN